MVSQLHRTRLPPVGGSFCYPPCRRVNGSVSVECRPGIPKETGNSFARDLDKRSVLPLRGSDGHSYGLDYLVSWQCVYFEVLQLLAISRAEEGIHCGC